MSDLTAQSSADKLLLDSAEEAVWRLRGGPFIDHLGWRLDSYELEHGKRPSEIRLPPVLGHQYMKELSIRERYGCVPYGEPAVTFCGVPVKWSPLDA